MERQISNLNKDKRFGLRDYVLVAVLAFISSLFYEATPLAWIVAFFAVVLYSLIPFIFENIGATAGTHGMTSMLAMPVTFAIASLPNLNAQFWIIATIIFVVLLILNLKEKFHTFGYSITHREISDFAILIGLAITITPFIPTDARIPIPIVSLINDSYKVHYNYINVNMLWKVVIMVSLMSFVAHFITKYIKGRNALVLATFFGGLVSSLATIVLLLRDRQEGAEGSEAPPLTSQEIFLGFVAANTGSIVKDVVVLRMVVGEVLFSQFVLPVVSALVMFFSISAYSFSSQSMSSGESQEIKITDRPLPLNFVFKFSSIFAILIIIMNMVTYYLGNGATVVASFMSGIISSAAAIGSVGTSMLQEGGISGWVAGLSILAALLGSICAKYVVIAKKLGLKNSLHFMLPILALTVVGLSTTWIAFHSSP
ncbi:MAG: DUF4010 domain-containing protein [Magnetococcales bacterium]|nr:DUF4010 domain-containing protein [Magnetococcales bacterium]